MRQNRDKTANEDFIERFRDGDYEAFNDFCIEYRSMIERAVHRRCRPQDKEDVIQEVLIRAFNCRTDYDPAKSKITTWICNIANNLAIDIYRHNTRKLKGHSVLNSSKDIYAISPKETSQVSIKFLVGISNSDAQILRMKYVEGMTSQAIANHLGMKKSAVVSKIHQLKIKLRSIHGNDAKSSFID